ncbi:MULTISPECIES: Crp/Fnr family transcriptional regulator [Streptacidiphilus]|uniref:Crp/Fnr family transcriptional regulator n=2 Tax=Streptacidiphilus TaxID=228398 RepID=A0ABV6ULW8_9ACTN|nr:Crp/Fnr family transcriptional regulator [Streptacidiphilus jeojiense]
MGLLGDDQAFARALTRQEYEAFLALGPRRSLPADTGLMVEGDRSTHVLLLLDGWATVSVSTDRGATRLILGIRGPGELLGELAALDNRPRSATVRALGPVEAVVVPGDSFRRFLAVNPRIGALVMRQLASRLRSADSERSALASMTVLRRLAARLVELSTVNGTGPYTPAGPSDRRGRKPPTAVVHLPQDELAATVGATREAVAKALRLLRDQQVVRTGNRRVEILEPALLKLLADGADGGTGERRAADRNL